MKIIMQFDPNFGFMGEAEPEALLHALFYDVDTRQERPDIIIWETHCFMEQECLSNNLDTYTVLTQRGIDMMQRIIDETHRRGIKAYWHHRISEVDAPPASFHSVVSENIIKKAHPDWLIRTWYEKGLWNLAVPEVQEFKVAYIKKMTERYPFDGICIDFLRHLPCLPPDAQWEHRDCVTDFMGKIRAAIPKDMKLGAKLPENAASCRVDGFDVAQWVKNGSLDFVLAGSRSVSSDVAWYKSITEGTNVEVYPCWDIWHCSDACHWREDAFYRGVFANWIAEKADGIVGFNYKTATAEIFEPLISGEGKFLVTSEFTNFFRQIQQCTDDTLPRTYVVERRGGYPWATGAGGTNCFAPLPAAVTPDAPARIPLKLYDTRSNITAQVLISGSYDAHAFAIQANGIPLNVKSADPAYLDRQIRWPAPQGTSSGSGCYTDSPHPLLMLTIPVPDDAVRMGENLFSVACTVDGDIHVERLEVTIS